MSTSTLPSYLGWLGGLLFHPRTESARLYEQRVIENKQSIDIESTN